MAPTTTRPRIGDVATQAGVSKTAVSFAFNSPERLNPRTVARIRATAEAMGYRPNPVARLLTQSRTMSIGILTPQALSTTFANPFFGTFAEGVAIAAEGSGYGLHFIAPDEGSLRLAVDRAIVDGMIVVGLASDHPEVDRLRQASMPMVMVDSTAMPDAPTIRVDDEGGAFQAAEHLLGLGHRDVLILSIAPPDDADPTRPRRADDGTTSGGGVGQDRSRGYDRAFRARGIPPDHLVRRRVRSTIQDGADAFHAVWSAGRRPTAVLAMSDAIAIGVMSAARDIGVRIPSDLSVVGFDDIELAAQIQPSLTTVHQPTRAKGEAAMRRLLALLDPDGAPTDPAADAEDVPILATYLVVRDSTGPVSPDLTSTTTGPG